MMKMIINGVLTITCSLLFQTTVQANPVTTIADGKKVKMHYTMKVDGGVVESSLERKPFEFVFGQGAVMPGLENGVRGLKAGDRKTLTIQPKEGFGEVDPQALVAIPKTRFSEDQDIKAGMVYNVQSQSGIPLRGIVKEVKEENVLLDFNHPLAGKKLELDVEILEVG